MGTNKKPRRWHKKLLKILLWLTGIFVVLICVIYFVLINLFPPEKLKTLAIEQLSSALNRRVSIGQVKLNLFKGIKIENVTIYESDSLLRANNALQPQFVSVDKISLKYRLLSLIKRKLIVHEILIESPQINVFLDELGRLNFDDIIAGETVAPADTTEETAELVLPISINLKRFELKNFSFSLSMLQDTTTLKMNFASLSGRVSGLFIPKDSLENILENVRVKTEIFMEQAQLDATYISKFDTLAIKLGTAIDLNIKAEANGIRQINASGKLRLGRSQLSLLFDPEPIFPANPPILPKLASLSFESQANLQTGTVVIPNIKFCLGNELLFSGNGKIDNTFENPIIDFMIQESNIRIDSLQTLAYRIAPPNIRTLLDDFDMNGTISLAGTHIQGNPVGLDHADGLKFSVPLKIDHFNLNYAQELAQFKNLILNVSAEGIYSEAGLANAALDLELNCPDLRLNPDDTLEIIGSNLAISIQSKLAENLFPTVIEIDAKIDDVFDSCIKLNLYMASAGNFDNFEAHGKVDISNIHLEKIVQEGIVGIVDSEILLAANSLDRIELNLTSHLDSLFLDTATGWEQFEALNLNGHLFVRTDTTLANFYIDPSAFILSDILSFNLQGHLLEFGEKGFEFKIDAGEIDHRSSFEWLPENFKEGIESLDISGQTKFKAVITGDIPAVGETNVMIDAHITHDKVDVDFPDAFLTVGDIKTESRLLISPENMDINTTVEIAEFTLADVRQRPIRNTSLILEADMPLFESIEIESCSLRMPDLKTLITVTGIIDSLADELGLHLLANLNFFSDDTCLIVDDLRLSGELAANISMHLRKNLFSTAGEVGFHRLNVNYTDSIKIRGIAGQIPFTQKIDIENLSLINEDIAYASATHATNMSYDYMRPFYEHLSRPMPRMRIEHINLLGYHLSNIVLDILLGGGRLEVPGFTLNMYDGNVAGKCNIDLAEVTFDDPDLLLDSTTFYVKTTFSSINSAKLNPAISAKAKESKINANMELKGTGLNPESHFEVTGYFYITDIGPKVADNFLRLLAPNDAFGIGFVRDLFRYGFKPKLMSFEIKHGHFYPKITLSQPRLFPLKIKGQKVELARMPIKLLLEQAMAPAYESE